MEDLFVNCVDWCFFLLDCVFSNSAVYLFGLLVRLAALELAEIGLVLVRHGSDETFEKSTHNANCCSSVIRAWAKRNVFARVRFRFYAKQP